MFFTGPLVLWKIPLNALAPTSDMDRTVLRMTNIHKILFDFAILEVFDIPSFH